METTLHQQLKRCYAEDVANTEVVLGKYRIDAVRDDELIEIQCASLSAINRKCEDLLKRHKLRVVKPVVARTRILKRKSPAAKITSRRMSPKRGNVLELFEELIYFTRVFPHPNLVIEVPMIHVEQIRMPSKRRRRRWQKDYQVHDVSLEQIETTHEFRSPADLFGILNWPDAPSQFNTADLAEAIGRPRWVAQQIAYVLKKTGAIETASRKRSGIVYTVAPSEPSTATGDDAPDDLAAESAKDSPGRSATKRAGRRSSVKVAEATTTGKKKSSSKSKKRKAA